MAKDLAIEVKDVHISYKILNNISIRNTLFHKKSRDEVFEAVKGITFDVEKGGILGIIGKNGSGKSTLLRSIAGVFSPNQGTIDLHNHSVSLMALGVGFKPLLTGRANIMLSGLLLGFSEKEIRQREEEIFEDMLVYTLFVLVKIYGDKLDNSKIDTSYEVDKDREHYGILFNGEDVYANIGVGIGIEMDSGIVVNGFDGKVIVANDWWNMGFFKIDNGNKYPKQYSFNFDGIGTRYMLQELMIIIDNKTDESTRVFYTETSQIAHLRDRVMRSLTK